MNEKKSGTSKKRIGLHLRRWLGCVMVALVTMPSAHSALITDPAICFATATDIVEPTGLPAPINVNDDITDSGYSGVIGTSFRIEIFDAFPPSTTIINDTSSLTPVTASQAFLKYSDFSTGDYCLYSFITTPQTATGLRSNFVAVLAPPNATAAAVPIFTPLGLIVTISGLLWFGRRRKGINLTQS
ncbi:hypothetical protein OO007_13355 [Cocleimonas sp. KMM 6892]|uniref:hypothetical protein n=1 Tax=unclassified Cocleimonas TaxID=2639732 RepID=UPI002DB9FD3B|nr:MULTISPECIES: hypothetical protein [unclassified Cocleimonas]MEB8433220.1 hypothetical protein [Cocleimonas sp. KMM 6892]MEC4715799.1 hypothetical protein [Cocleimonas sp. KMM 6895]MEC4745260.1 hypothetical protein [Cocleimonas sp. KMM 6896]